MPTFSPKKILIIGPSWVGDTIMAQSLFKLLKQRDPNVVIDVLAPAWTFSILSCMPEVAQAIEIPIMHGELKLRERYRISQQLAASGYDQAIILPNSFKSALIPWLARIPVRTGYLREFRGILLNDGRKLDVVSHPLMVEQYLALGVRANETLAANYLYPSLQANSAAQQAALAKHQPLYRGRPILALCAGAEFGSAKRWPAEYYAEVVQQKIADGWDVWLFGSAKDKVVTDHIMTLTHQQCENLAGRLQLTETLALLSLTSGVISNDSGLMHMAAALDKPVMVIYGSTSDQFTPPLSQHAIILKLHLPCQPCFQRECPLKHHRCMRDITPDQVLAACAHWEHR